MYGPINVFEYKRRPTGFPGEKIIRTLNFSRKTRDYTGTNIIRDIS